MRKRKPNLCPVCILLAKALKPGIRAYRVQKYVDSGILHHSGSVPMLLLICMTISQTVLELCVF